MFSVVVAFAFVADGEGFVAALSAPEFARKAGRRATAVRKGLDGTDAVVLHPARGNDSAAASKTRRPMRARLSANPTLVFAAWQQGGRARGSRLVGPQVVCGKRFLGGHMLHCWNENTNASALLILHYR
jgi:hypothetical protein